ncbi:MAG TPA: glycosyltransferase family 9 protein [Usitatibacteraceae bacterium]|nr:glycosyltransferase family 9 protein [Usitatibacteraceae bacterium]
MGERFATRSAVVARAILRRLAAPGLASAPASPRRILVAHHLLLGDTIMLSPLLAKLRANHPQAEVVMTVPPATLPLYASRPWGVRALAFSPRDSSTVRPLLDEGPFDLAVVPGDNRHAWLAAAMGARHVVAHAGDLPATKNWFVDDARPYPDSPAPWGEMVADLVDGVEPAPCARGDWPDPPAAPVDHPKSAYAVLHVGASTALKRWPADRWAALASALSQRGLAVVWSAGRGEEALVEACDPGHRHASTAGRLDLAQLWHLLARAALVVSPDTGVSHLGRAIFVPTITLFGPGSAPLCGPGPFWGDAPWRALGEAVFPCRDQTNLFRRDVAWVRRCSRGLDECSEPRCMQAIAVPAVLAAADEFLGV